MVALFTVGAVGNAVLNHHWEAATPVNKGTVTEIGVTLLTKNVLAFEMISLVLLVAIIGSVIIARRGRGTAVKTGGETE